MRRFAILSLLLLSFLGFSQNLIVNPGAEIEPLTSNGWTATCTGACTWIGSPPEKGSTHGGAGHFYAGDNSGSTVELYQDVNVTSYAASIDAGTANFTFSGWTAMYNAAGFCNNDPAQIIVEFRNASNVFISTMCNSGWRTNISWGQYAPAAVTAPVGTRFIRVRLMSRKDCGTAADGYFDDLSLTTPAALPVSLINFDAQEKHQSILLSWSTSSETNNHYFTIEKSVDGNNWFEIARVYGAGNSSIQRNYSYEDLAPQPGILYYRLRQTDADGLEANYDAVSVNYHAEVELYVYPNPTLGTVNVKTSDEADQSQVRFINLTGQVVHEENVSGNTHEFDLRGLPAGIYIIEYFNSGHISRTTLKKE